MTKHKPDLLSQAFGVDPTEPEVIEIAEAEPLTFDAKDHINDYQFARQTAHDLIVKGKQALELALIHASGTSATARPYEVIAILLKTVADANIQLLDIQNKYKTLQLKFDAPSGASTEQSEELISKNSVELLRAARKTG